ncbi:MAG TPA: DUF4249 domain-containing protein [Draconibacterium sp.]|nr:DUF4249 domain-containing protein [Draconibacterium sp.]
MKKLTTIFIFLILSIFIFTACEDVIDVDINDVDIDLISVEAYLNTKSTDNIYVKLEKTLPVNTATKNPAISNAIVEISDDESNPNKVILEEEENSGIYKIPENVSYEAVPGRTYRLSITTTDGVIITGEDYLQKGETLDSTKIQLSARGNYDFLAVFINSQETPGLGHYYKWDIFINGELLNESENMSFVNDELVDGNYVYDFEIYTDFGDPNDEEDRNFHLGDTVYVEQLSISENAYNFYFGMVNQAFAGGPFSVPPANIKSNLSASDGKRVLGIFSVRDVSVGRVHDNCQTRLYAGLVAQFKK